VHQRAGRLSEAEDGAREALRINATVLGETHSYAAHGHLRLATVLQAQHRFAEAEPELQAALRIAENPKDVFGREAAPVMRAALAELYTAWGRPELAAAYR
jgi:tetratricopeptide (TPR) repeat protein